jgi:hypothetical protein
VTSPDDVVVLLDCDNTLLDNDRRAGRSPGPSTIRLPSRLYPGALDATRHLRTWGLTVILSDGDVAFQPRKIQRSGLWAAVEGWVLIDIHKERMLDAVVERIGDLATYDRSAFSGAPRAGRPRGEQR